MAGLACCAAAGLLAVGLIGLIIWGLVGVTVKQPQPQPLRLPNSPHHHRQSCRPRQSWSLLLRLLKRCCGWCPSVTPRNPAHRIPAFPPVLWPQSPVALLTDTSGPRVGRYTLVADLPVLQAQFTEITASTRQQICPGNIQSPGPWRHNATPEQVAGQLYCGVRGDGTPIIAWTDDARLLPVGR